MKYKGDFLLGETVTIEWGTVAGSGGSTDATGAGKGTLKVYKGALTPASTAGITDGRDIDGLTGNHVASIVLTDPFYIAHADYQLALVGAVIDGQPVNAWLGSFSIMNRTASRLMVAGTVDASAFSPTPTAFECSDITTEAANNNLAGRSVYGAVGNALIKQVGVIDTSSVVGGRGHFTLPAGAPMTGPFVNGARILIV
jgi:hypothetical protein